MESTHHQHLQVCKYSIAKLLPLPFSGINHIPCQGEGQDKRFRLIGMQLVAKKSVW
jgi:hypothetical protein